MAKRRGRCLSSVAGDPAVDARVAIDSLYRLVTMSGVERLPVGTTMLPSLLPSILVLGLAALIAMLLAVRRPSPPEREGARRAASNALAIALLVQTVHFTEEAVTGFNERLGPLLGLPGMSMSFFVPFNVAWLLIWLVSIPALRSSSPPAFFAAWFLSIAGMINGIAHPLLALVAGGYFPGTITSPVIAGASLWLWMKLRQATSPATAVDIP